MSDELDVLLRATVRAEAPDWLEQLVTERAVASVEREASSLSAACRGLWDHVVRLARDARRRARPQRTRPSMIEMVRSQRSAMRGS